MRIRSIQKKTSLQIHRPRVILFCLLAGWTILAGASTVLVPEVATPAPLGSSAEHLSQTAEGQLILSWVEQVKVDKEKTVRRLRFSLRQAGGWTTPQTVVTTAHWLGGPPAVVGLSDGTLAAAWIAQAELYVSRSTDKGKHWSEPWHPYSKAAKAYEGQKSVAPLSGARLALTWKDKRGEGGMQIMGTVVDFSKGASSEIALDRRICPCCAADTVAAGDTLYTVYRDRLPGEVRDIALIRWPAEGDAPSQIVHHDHWSIEACPVNGPAVAARADGLTVVAWFTAVSGQGQVLAAFSPPGERAFGDAITVGANANGQVEALLLDDGSALIAWLGRAGPVTELLLARVRPNGAVDGPVTVYRGALPRWPSISLTQAGDSVYLAWTDTKAQRVRLVAIPLDGITAVETVARGE